MNIDLKAPSGWDELNADHFRELTKMLTMHITREELLVIAFCKFTGVKRIDGNRYVTADGAKFEMQEWQLIDFCERLSWMLEKPNFVTCPGKVDSYLRDVNFGDYWEIDSQFRLWSENHNPESLSIIIRKIGIIQHDLDESEVLHLSLWWQWVSDMLVEKYPSVFLKNEDGGGGQSPFDTLNEINYMLRKSGLYSDVERVYDANVHSVLHDLNAEIEAAKRNESAINKHNR